MTIDQSSAMIHTESGEPQNIQDITKIEATFITSSENPLLELGSKILFDKIKPEHIEPAVTELIVEAKNKIEAICSLSGARTFDNTILALDEATDRLDRIRYLLGLLRQTTSSERLRDNYDKVETPLSEFETNIVINERLWSAVNAFAETPEAQALTGVKKLFLTKTIDSFRREGAELSYEHKNKLREINATLARLTTRFSSNVQQSTDAYELIIDDPTQLRGLPDRAIAEAQSSARMKNCLNKYRLTIQQPFASMISKYLDDPIIRKDIHHAFFSRASTGEYNNTDIINGILDLRKQKAQLLGFENFADLALADHMAGNGKRAINFIEELRNQLDAQARSDAAKLLRFRREIEGPDAPELASWDLDYYSEKMRQHKCKVNQEMLRPYFSVDGVLSGMFEVALRLFGIKVQEIYDLPVWHEDVRSFAIHDRDGNHLGSFYCDLFSRAEKAQGAWMTPLIIGGSGEKGFQPHLGAICTNFSPPRQGEPALLNHYGAKTLFHEFGHLLHLCLSTVEIRSLAGTDVAWDFVEFPSELMERWCWEPECLQLYAKHYQTGEPIPTELVDKMLEAQCFDRASLRMSLIGCAILDLKLHTEYLPDGGASLLEYCRKEFAPFIPAPLPDDYAMITTFSHLFSRPGWYAASFYSYMWSDTLAADAFTRFKRAGIFNQNAGQELREKILSKGGSADPTELFEDFMGRKLNARAFLDEMGS
jgi:oligopeptidase A